jgi:SAM-dependent methyltransferase
MEAVFAAPADPTDGLRDLFERVTAFLHASRATGLGSVAGPAARTVTDDAELVTGEHYGRLFREFDAKSFAEEPARLLRDRLTRNDVALPDLTTARVLDAGCGGGRYSVAWKLLGAADVTGVDFSQPGIADARARIAAVAMEGIRFEAMDVVDLPLSNDSFDIVFSNGVLHHTRDWQRGVRRLVEVLRPGGLGWLYLIENPGGYFWDVIELLREVMKQEVHEQARSALVTLGLPANRIFYMLDHVMVPINLRLTADEIEHELVSAGARGCRRLLRGADFDRVERIYQGDPHASMKYGGGEHRFVFSK